MTDALRICPSTLRTLATRSVAAVLVALNLATGVQADTVTVAVASNFAVPFEAISEAFSASTGHALKVSVASTGKFYSQIAAGAPFEVLLAADDETPKKLMAEGHALSGSASTYAIGQLVLWSATPDLVDDKGAVLSAGKFAHLAIANPKLAPYGRAALEVLTALGLQDRLAGKLVRGESIAQAFQFVATGNAELGFVALSQVAVPGKPTTGSMWRVPPSLYGEIRQDAVLLKAGENKAAARALLAFLKSSSAQAVIQRHGYLLPR